MLRARRQIQKKSSCLTPPALTPPALNRDVWGAILQHLPTEAVFAMRTVSSAARQAAKEEIAQRGEQKFVTVSSDKELQLFLQHRHPLLAANLCPRKGGWMVSDSICKVQELKGEPLGLVLHGSASGYRFLREFNPFFDPNHCPAPPMHVQRLELRSMDVFEYMLPAFCQVAALFFSSCRFECVSLMGLATGVTHTFSALDCSSRKPVLLPVLANMEVDTHLFVLQHNTTKPGRRHLQTSSNLDLALVASLRGTLVLSSLETLDDKPTPAFQCSDLTLAAPEDRYSLLLTPS